MLFFKPKFKSATECIVHVLKTKGSITSLECIKLTGHTRLSSTIHRLRSSGMNITTIISEVVTMYGFKTQIATYYLEK